MPTSKEIQIPLIAAAKTEYEAARNLPWEAALSQLEATMAYGLKNDSLTSYQLPNDSAQELMEEIASGRLPIMLFFVTKLGGERTIVLPFPEHVDSQRNRVDVTTNKAELDSDVKYICDLVAHSVKMGRKTQFGANIQVIQQNLGYAREKHFISWADLDERVIRAHPNNLPGYAQAIERAVTSLS